MKKISAINKFFPQCGKNSVTSFAFFKLPIGFRGHIAIILRLVNQNFPLFEEFLRPKNNVSFLLDRDPSGFIERDS